MQRVDLPLLVHGEVTAGEVDVFDREARFIESVLEPLRRDFPGLRVVFEHITTREAPTTCRPRRRNDATAQRSARRSPRTICCTAATRCS